MELFIVNEVYPFSDEKAFEYFKGRMNTCGKDEKCQSWVKYDAETYVKEHAMKVGVKVEELVDKKNSATNTGESEFIQLTNVKYEFKGDKTDIIKWVVIAILIVLVLFAIKRKSMALGSVAVVGGAILFFAPDKVFPKKEIA